MIIQTNNNLPFGQTGMSFGFIAKIRDTSSQLAYKTVGEIEDAAKTFKGKLTCGVLETGNYDVCISVDGVDQYIGSLEGLSEIDSGSGKTFARKIIDLVNPGYNEANKVSDEWFKDYWPGKIKPKK